MKKQKDVKGITAEKDEFSDWFTQILQKAELIEYTGVSGCYIFRPKAYAIWEKLKDYFDKKIKADGVKNAYFPMLIPESLLNKEKEHVEGFSPEVAWVTQSGNTQLAEKLALRPTSETIMYPAYAKWIRSWRDLPLRLNQWCNVVRWEFKNPIPFIRSREFLWQEGHTVFATKEEAEKEAEKILDLYEDTYKNLYAVPIIKGRKTDKEKFAGADYTLTTEVFLPSGKVAQGATSHHLGQHFSKAFNIKFEDKDKKEKFAWQNSWGITTRSIGIAIMMHSDSRGLVLSPNIADIQSIIIPIYKTPGEKAKAVNEAKKIQKSLPELRIEIDDREEYKPGYKFNEWEMKGVPLRIEIGPKDIRVRQVILVRRDNGKKESCKIKNLNKKIPSILKNIHDNLYKKAQKFLRINTIKAKKFPEVISAIQNKKLVKTEWCGTQTCEDWIKDKTGGAKIACIVKQKPKSRDKCVFCNKKAVHTVYIAKSY